MPNHCAFRLSDANLVVNHSMHYEDVQADPAGSVRKVLTAVRGGPLDAGSLDQSALVNLDDDRS